MLWAVVVRNARFRLRELGPEAEVMAELESLRFAMRRLARGRGSLDAAPQVARRLDGMLFGSMRLGDGPLVIVPTPTLHATPWWAMSTCQARPVSISPSAELWYVARQATSRQEHVLVAAGPDLELSDAEVAEVGALYPGATLFRSEDSLVETVQTHLDGAGLAHIASHAYFQFENPMFSSLRLADGDLNVYDIERLSTAPSLVVLSACDSGFTETHPGEELMGLSSALLSMGTKTVIASVGIVPDSAATKDLMVALHRGLIAGLSPSHALQEAQSQVAGTPEGYIAASSFICIGAG
jgi:CHAT domain-containing protein